MRVTLDELCTQIVDCEHRTAPIDPNGEFFVVGTPAMRGNVINYAEARRVSSETFLNWTRRLDPKPGDLLFAREAPVGPIVRIPEGANVAPGQRTVLLRPDPARADAGFMYYLLSSAVEQDRLTALSAGSTVRHLNVADVRAFGVSVPDLASQKAIAEVLGALEGKIAANAAVASQALELADLKFACSIRGATYSDLSFEDLGSVGGGGTPSTKEPQYWGGDVPWATPTDVTGLTGPYLLRTERKITEEGLANCSSALYPPGSIMMTSRATIGAFALNDRPTAVNQGFIVVQPKNSSQRYWLLHEMRSRVDEFISRANGATFLELSRGNFKRLPVRLAEPSLVERFNHTAEALHQASREALRQNATLAATRDALVPRLMSGKLRVKDAEKVVVDAGV